MMVTDHSVDLKVESFKDAWMKFNKIQDIEAPPDLPCVDCPDLQYCGYCPPAMKLENDMRVGSNDFLCRLARQKRQEVEKFAQELSEVERK